MLAAHSESTLLEKDYKIYSEFDDRVSPDVTIVVYPVPEVLKTDAVSCGVDSCCGVAVKRDAWAVPKLQVCSHKDNTVFLNRGNPYEFKCLVNDAKKAAFAFLTLAISAFY